MAKGKQRRREIAAKKARKRESMGQSKRRSRYARKRAYLARMGGWGTEYPDKPWR